MPALSVAAVRAALLQLGLGALAGALLTAAKALTIWPWAWALRPLHVHLLLIGWLVQLAFGVAFWILPRLGPGGTREREPSAWIALGALNSAVALSLAQLLPASALRAGLLTGAGLLYILAGAAMLWHGWVRVGALPALEETQNLSQHG